MTRPSPSGAAELPVFVYGTLKEGFHNHAHYCRGVQTVRHAIAWGRLHLWEPGIPILAVPERQVLLQGSPDHADDIAAAERFLRERGDSLSMRMGPQWHWRRIRGELLGFSDGTRRLGILDALEGFHPRTGARAYQRVLMTVQLTEPEPGDAGFRAAWCYVLPHGEEAPSEPLDLTNWEPGLA